MDFNLWYIMLRESVYWQDIDPHMALEIYQRTVVAWGMDEHYYMQGLERVDLTKLYEQYKLIETIKGTHHGEEIRSEHC
jgi:hypothetical protein